MTTKSIPCFVLIWSIIWNGCSTIERHSAAPEANREHSAGGLQISVRLDKGSYVVGEEIAATVEFWNVNKREIFAPTEIPRFDTVIVATDERGQRLEPRKPPGWDNMSDFEKRVVKAVQQARFTTLPRGAKENYRVNLNDIFEFANPGVYQIVIVYHSGQNASTPIDAYSETVSFAVRPAASRR